MKLAEDLLALVNEISSDHQLSFKKFYLGLTKNNRPNNFIGFRPQRNSINLDIKMGESEDIQKKIDERNIFDIGYKYGCYRIKLNKEEVKKNNDFLKELFEIAYKNSQ